MKLALAMCAPGPAWLGWVLAEPTTVPPSSATTVRAPGLPDVELPRVELSGDSDCVLATHSTPGVSDACWRGPVARYVWDLADRRRSRWIVPFGAAGSPDSPHFLDQLPLWAAGELIPVFGVTFEEDL